MIPIHACEILTDPGRHCEEQRDEAIQNLSAGLDCFVSLAMTVSAQHSLALRQPRPTNGIRFAITVMNSTLVSSGRLAI